MAEKSRDSCLGGMATEGLHLALPCLIEGNSARPLETSVGKTLKKSDNVSSLNNTKKISSPIKILKYLNNH